MRDASARHSACLLLLLAVAAAAVAQAQQPLTPASAAATQYPDATPGTATSAPAAAPAAAATPEATTPASAPLPAPAAATPEAATPTPEPAPAPQTAPAADATQKTRSLPPFSAVVSCLPVNVLLRAAPDNASYAISSGPDLDPAVEAALTVAVANRTLFLGVNGSFSSASPVRLAVTLPPGQLVNVTNRGLGDVIIQPGFATDATALSADGAGRVLARRLNTGNLTVTRTGVADVFARGAIVAATVNARGSARVTLSGVSQSVAARLAGITSLFVDAASDDVKITGNPTGISKIIYTRGQCSAGQRLTIDVPFFAFDMGLSGCARAGPEAFPRYSARWSCGVRVRGTAPCSPDAEAAASSAADSADISVTASSTAATPTPSPAAATPAPAPAAPAEAPAAPGPAPAASPASPSSIWTPVANQLQAPAASREAADISILGRRRLAAAAAAADGAAAAAAAGPGRRLQGSLVLPWIDFDSMFEHHKGRRGSSSSNSGNTVVRSSSSSASSEAGGSSSSTVRSIECNAPREQLYIAADA